MNNFENSIIDLAKDYVFNILNKDTSGHDYYHCIRVYKNALNIAKHYQVDNQVIALAALLHDLDDPKISKNTNHAETFLNENNIENKTQILDIIQNMSFSAYKAGKKLSSLEGKIVQDADRLDALGAIGISRCFAYSGHINRPIYVGEKDDFSAIAHFYQKLFKLQDLMNTEEAKIQAKEKIDFMNEFLEKFYQEWEWKWKSILS